MKLAGATNISQPEFFAHFPLHVLFATVTAILKITYKQSAKPYEPTVSYNMSFPTFFDFF